MGNEGASSNLENYHSHSMDDWISLKKQNSALKSTYLDDKKGPVNYKESQQESQQPIYDSSNPPHSK